MDILVSSPGSPGTNFTENVKEQILLISDELDKNDDFASLMELKKHLENCGLNQNYARNILPFLQNCGIVKYDNIDTFKNSEIVTNIGRAYVDVLKSIKIARNEEKSEIRDDILEMLDKIQQTIYFQCLTIMMKNPDCNYGIDFFDVLRFVDIYGYIDLTEYMLILYEREKNGSDYLHDLQDVVKKYRNKEIEIHVKTKTKNAMEGDGKSKSVNSFPYVTGNFCKSGIMKKIDGKFYFEENRIKEIENAIEEVAKYRNLVR